MPERGIPAHSIGRIFGKLSNMRVAKSSKQALAQQLEAWSAEIAERALIYMKHAHRKTVLEEDIKLAIEDVFK